MHSTHIPLKVSFYGHFGSANAGNESTLLAILARLRAISTETTFRCICSLPEVVVERDGIDAVPITTRAAKIWDRRRPLSRRVPMAFVELEHDRVYPDLVFGLPDAFLSCERERSERTRRVAKCVGNPMIETGVRHGPVLPGAGRESGDVLAPTRASQPLELP